ncbi:septal ring lytic transglycosylase RlpA family protein [Pseudomonadota bacterium]
MSRLVFAVTLAVLLLAACAGEKKKDTEPGDGPSSRKITAADVRDAVPADEPLARYGNHSPYSVLGKTYTVLPTSKGYHERGIASWYGSKFHGRRTSSGEIYDMHLATAAHKSLPLPTYAEVTNLDNGRKIIVKINDRGPFHEDRIIDLSYAAAIKLGVDQTGTARIDVRAIDVKRPQPSAVKVADGTFLQVGAFSKRKTADDLAGKMLAAQLKPVSVQKSRGLYKVWIGPYASETEIEASRRRVVELGYESPHKVSR